MSTQTAESIPLTHISPQQGLKLLELPRELAGILSSDNAPVLELKYLSSEQTQNTSEQEYVNLCTLTQTYQVRQVQSSNSIHVLRPSERLWTSRALNGNSGNGIAHDNDEEEDYGHDEDFPEEDFSTSRSMASIAKCTSTLELHHPPQGFSAIPFLLKSLRLYNRLSSDGGPERGNNPMVQMEVDDDMITDLVDSDGHDGGRRRSKETITKDHIFANVPVSRVQCERVWSDICAFVYHDTLHDQGRLCGWRPSALVRLDTWKRIMEGAVLQNINLEKLFRVDDLWKAMLDDDDDTGEPFPRGLYDAVLRRVCEKPDQEDSSLASECGFPSPLSLKEDIYIISHVIDGFSFPFC